MLSVQKGNQKLKIQLISYAEYCKLVETTDIARSAQQKYDGFIAVTYQGTVYIFAEENIMHTAVEAIVTALAFQIHKNPFSQDRILKNYFSSLGYLSCPDQVINCISHLITCAVGEKMGNRVLSGPQKQRRLDILNDFIVDNI